MRDSYRASRAASGSRVELVARACVLCVWCVVSSGSRGSVVCTTAHRSPRTRAGPRQTARTLRARTDRLPHSRAPAFLLRRYAHANAPPRSPALSSAVSGQASWYKYFRRPSLRTAGPDKGIFIHERDWSLGHRLRANGACGTLTAQSTINGLPPTTTYLLTFITY